MTQDLQDISAAPPSRRIARRWLMLIAAMLAVGVIYGIAHVMKPTSNRQGEVVKVDPGTRRMVIRELPQGGEGAEGATWSVQVKQGLDIAALRPGDRIEFSIDTQARGWTVNRAGRQP